MTPTDMKNIGEGVSAVWNGEGFWLESNTYAFIKVFISLKVLKELNIFSVELKEKYPKEDIS